MSAPPLVVPGPGIPGMRGGRPRRAVLVGFAVALVGAGVCAPLPGGAAHAAVTPAVVLDFGRSPGGRVDLTNTGHPQVLAEVVKANGGQVVAAPGPEGPATALRFPALDDAVDGPRAVLVAQDLTPSDGDALSPGTDALTLQVDLALDAENAGGEGDNGNNVIQRGLSGQDAQFKLDVDRNLPRCTVAQWSETSRSHTQVRVATALVPSRWYRLTCTRTGTFVRLELLDLSTGRVSRASGRTPEVVDLSWPAKRSPVLSIGGKVNLAGRPVGSSDQFNGVLDRVRVSIGRE